MKLRKLNLFILTAFAAFGFMFGAKAADNKITLSCTPQDISVVGGVSEESLCTVKLSAKEELQAVAVTLETSKYVQISNIKANSNIGWTLSQTGTNVSSGVYAFAAPTGSPIAASDYDLFSFSVTLSPEVANIKESDADCGHICIAAVTFNGGTQSRVSEGSGTCFAPILTEGEEEPKKENPETGSFMNYLLISSVFAVAIAAIIIARRNNKFYRV